MQIEKYASLSSKVVFKTEKLFMYGLLSYSCQMILTGRVSTESSDIS